MAEARRLGGPGFAVVETALGTIARHGMVAAGDSVVVGLSGGADSTCLLDVLARSAQRLDITLEVAHVDHGLAPGSEELATRVARDAAAAGFDVHVGRARDLAGPNLQARARAFRYGFLETVAEQTGAARIATGHTLDDRVETTLARLVHGAGTEGLAGIPAAEGRRIRPLIDLRRRETRSYCEERSLEFFDDPANEDARFERVVVRRGLVGAIERHWGDGAVRAIATSAAHLREDADALESLVERLYGGLASSSGDEVELDAEAMSALPRALQRRVLERAVGRVRDRAGGIDAALQALVRPRDRLLRFSVASGIEIGVGPDRIFVSRPANSSQGDTRMRREAADGAAHHEANG
jgi:tRNA(Ile)-lysidine synthase